MRAARYTADGANNHQPGLLDEYLETLSFTSSCPFAKSRYHHFANTPFRPGVRLHKDHPQPLRRVGSQKGYVR